MAEMGMRSADFYVGASLFTLSRVAFMAGCYPTRVNLQMIRFV